MVVLMARVVIMSMVVLMARVVIMAMVVLMAMVMIHGHGFDATRCSEGSAGHASYRRVMQYSAMPFYRYVSRQRVMPFYPCVMRHHVVFRPFFTHHRCFAIFFQTRQNIFFRVINIQLLNLFKQNTDIQPPSTPPGSHISLSSLRSTSTPPPGDHLTPPGDKIHNGGLIFIQFLQFTYV